MTKIERTASKKETLTIKPCPACGGEVSVTDCGYSSFNPGTAQCKECPREWGLGYVNDRWHAGLTWNHMQPSAVEIAKLENEIEIAKDRIRELRKGFES